MALLVISLLLLSTAFLSEAIDSVGFVPDLKLGSPKRRLKIPGVYPNSSFGQSCDVEGFYNETEEEALMSVRGSTGTSYLRAVVFGKYEGGVWTPHESVREAYAGESMPPWVRSYSEKIEKDVVIKPFVNLSGYIPAVLNLRRIDSEAPLEYDRDLRIFFSETPFTTEYSLSYDFYTYGEDTLESARIVDDPSNLEIPEGFAGWLKGFADEAAGDATTPYGRIKNIISYLKENYAYNLEYPPAPAGVDPVEWFLTGSREGVCTHFNSALVLLARSLGIPARLAGGYLIQPEVEAQLVYTRQRHAFSEIPFEELGWIIFDATPAVGCSECEGVESDGEEPGEEERADTYSPTDSVYNQSSYENNVNNCTKLSPEGGAGPEVDLFEIRGVTGSNYLRTMVGERYDGLWNLVWPEPKPYGGGPISYPVSGYADDPTYAFTISPLKEMGGFIPTALYTNELRLDAEVELYQDQLIFFSTEVFREPYSLSITSFEFDYKIVNEAVPISDPRYLNVTVDLLDGFRSIALDATSGAGTPYEKLKALAAFLRNNYEYDVNYTRAPEGVDPVEWFLFHEGRGVCANFNSAFVLLARSIGLPARLVVGYAIDPGVEWQVVNASQAHAYSEVLFEGIGWINFDATAPAGGSGEVRERDGEKLEPVEEVFNQTECEDCVNNRTKMDPEGEVPPEVDLFQIYGVTGTAYLRTMVGEAYDGTWGMIDPSPEAYENEVIRHQVSGYVSTQTRRFMVAPMVDMGGFMPSTLYVSELDLGSPKGLKEEFLEFLNKYGVIGLAIAVIIGGAAGKLISALVDDILMPIITFFIPGGAWREAVLEIGPIQLSIGHFTGAVIDFLIIAWVVFLLMKQLGKTRLK